tara:strand:- start:32 stop:679 length:648 start_codon:yes stop_codon:yes gene_type:complete
MSNFSERVSRILAENQLTIMEFCTKIGLSSQTTIAKIISENRKPSSKTFGRILKGFPDVNYQWLINGEGNMYKSQITVNKHADDLTVTAKQIIDRLEFDKGYYDNKLKEDRKHYADKRKELNDESNAELLQGFKVLEKKVQYYAETATTKVVKIMMEGLAEQNKMLIDGYAKVIKLESELEDIKTFMAAKFELQKMKKKKAKQIEKLTPRIKKLN